ncbi:MAG: amidohydrolase family protein [Candidatus Rokubacteria bacterium]|nr:amidohydrolase family protein [Candidatus Rokubacteria bacterium]
MTARSVDTLVTGGRVVTASDVVEAAVAIEGGKIVALGPASMLPPAERTIDAGGKYVLPGLIDCHLHVGPEYDDWKTAPVAAARTGLTTLLPFVIYDEGETLPQAAARLREEAEALSVLDFGFHFILNHEPRILDGIPDAFRLGVTSFKLFMTYKKRGKRMVSDEFIAKTMERLARLGGLCQLHCENGDVLCYLEDKAIAEGRTAPTDFPATCPDWTEEEAINRAVLIGRLTGCPAYVVHLSTKLGLERIIVDAEGKPIPFGAPSLETLVPLMYSEGVVKRGLPITWLARVLSENPARIFGLYPRKGAIRIGADADLTIWDPAPEGTIARTQHLGIAGFTPYEGWKVRGRPWMTLVRGQVVLNPQGEVEPKPGAGRYLACASPLPPVSGAVR